MNHRDCFKIKHPKLVCIGTGLVALDVIINGNSKASPRLFAGGSCGNILTILSYLGWESYPIANLADDMQARKVLRDMKRWKVNTGLISLNGSGSTPIIVERLGTNPKGIPWHRFEWTCPTCGSWLPKYKPVPAQSVAQIAKKMPKANVFYFDKVSQSSVDLAKASKRRGALVVFEPSRISYEEVFLKCLQVAHIVKYSYEKLADAQQLTQNICVPLEIQTLKEEGLRYRVGGNRNSNRKWKRMPAFPVEKLKDAAGAGDWCSAGIIHLLGNARRKSIVTTQPKLIDRALSFGQALASLNCHYEGARGSMYNISRRKFESLISVIWKGDTPLYSTEERETQRALQVFRHICPSCNNKNKSKN